MTTLELHRVPICRLTKKNKILLFSAHVCSSIENDIILFNFSKPFLTVVYNFHCLDFCMHERKKNFFRMKNITVSTKYALLNEILHYNFFLTVVLFSTRPDSIYGIRSFFWFFFCSQSLKFRFSSCCQPWCRSVAPP